MKTTTMAGNSPELKRQKNKKKNKKHKHDLKKKKFLSVTRLKVLLRKKWKRRRLRGAASNSSQKFRG